MVRFLEKQLGVRVDSVQPSEPVDTEEDHVLYMPWKCCMWMSKIHKRRRHTRDITAAKVQDGVQMGQVEATTDWEFFFYRHPLAMQNRFRSNPLISFLKQTFNPILFFINRNIPLSFTSSSNCLFRQSGQEKKKHTFKFCKSNEDRKQTVNSCSAKSKCHLYD